MSTPPDRPCNRVTPPTAKKDTWVLRASWRNTYNQDASGGLGNWGPLSGTSHALETADELVAADSLTRNRAANATDTQHKPCACTGWRGVPSFRAGFSRALVTRGEEKRTPTMSAILAETGVSVRRAARQLDVSESMIRVWLRMGKVRHVHSAIGILIDPEDLERFAAERAQRKQQQDVSGQATVPA